MYSRKLRQPNKKRKTSFTKAKNTGSNWGPRIALYEREKAAAASTSHHRDHGLKHVPCLPTYYKKRERRSSISYSSMSSGPLSQSASSSSYIYNSGSQIKSSESGSTSKGGDSALYTLHSSVFTDDEDDEHTRDANNKNDRPDDILNEKELTRPLSLLIPPQNSYDLDFDKSRRLEEDSLASTQTYRSSCDEEPSVGLESPSSPGEIKTSGILQVSTTQPQIHSCPPDTPEGSKPGSSGTNSNAKNSDGSKTIDRSSTGRNSGDTGTNRSKYRSLARDLPIDSPVTTLKGKVDGSTIAALAQGTLVYVPMESVPRSKSAAAMNTIRREKSKTRATEDDGEDTDDEESLYDEATFEPRSSSPVSTPNFPSMQENVEQETESSLQTFDPSIFKKLSLNPVVKSVMKKGVCESDQSVPEVSECTIDQCSGTKQIECSDQRQVKSIRFSEINVEIPASRQSERDESGDVTHHSDIETTQCRVQKVTLTLPGQDPPCEQQLLINYDNGNDHYSCTMLSCGHTKTDNYSTLSSITSRQLSDVDGELSERTSVDTRSALQQLRDLSLLIGGSFHNSAAAAEKENRPSFRLHEESPRPGSSKKKDLLQREEITDDSGKGSGSSRTQTSSDASPHTGSSLDSSSPNMYTINHTNDDMEERHPENVQENSTNTTDKKNKGPPKPTSQTISKCPCGQKSCLFHTDCEECIKLLTENPYERPTARIISNTKKRKDKGTKNALLIRRNSVRSSSTGKRKNVTTVKLRRTPSKIYSSGGNNSQVKSSKNFLNPRKSQVLLDYCDCERCEQRYAQIGDSVCITDNKIAINKKSERSIVDLSEQAERKLSKSSKLNRSVAFREKNGKRQSIVTYQVNNNHTKNGRFLDSCSQLHPSVVQQGGIFIRNGYPNIPIPNCCNGRHINNNGNASVNMCKAGLFTIEEREENVYNSGSPFGNNKGKNQEKRIILNRQRSMEDRPLAPPSPGDFCKEKNWGIPDAAFGWSDLESLYSQNMKNENCTKMSDECWTCWKEVAESKKTSVDPNRTVDRTKRMFIWLNRRPKEYQAPWWEAKKQASIRWLVTKALAHLSAKKVIEDPFKESKKGKATKYRLREEITKGLLTGKLYCLALDNLYGVPQRNQQQTNSCQGLTHWDIIKILSRRGIYVAQPSDMKLTEGTLRQKPIRLAAHIALIEAIMALFCKEVLDRERIIATLRSLGVTSIELDSPTPEQLIIAWMNGAIMTIKSYIISNRKILMSADKVSRWLEVRKVCDLRDLCDGIGICSLLALYCSNDVKVEDISVPEPGESLTIYDSITNHSMVQKVCEELFPETLYHVCVTDFLYIHGYMKQNILCFLVDLFNHLEVNPIVRVNRLTHVPIRVEL